MSLRSWCAGLIVGVILGGLLMTMSAWASGSHSASRHFSARQGDTVSLPALHWTCLMSSAATRPLFTCTSDRKPIAQVVIQSASITVGGSGKPIPVHGGYRFHY